jgi:MFS family permease
VPDKKTSKKPSVVSTKSSPAGIGRSFQSFLNRSYGESRAYVVEYGLLLLLTGVLLGLLTNMVQSIFEYIGDKPSRDMFFGFDYSFSVFILSAVIIIIPLVAILIQRTSEAERKNPRIKNSSWRKGLLGAFIAILSLASLSTAIGLLASLISAATLIDVPFNPRADLASFVSLAVFVVTAWIFGQDYREGISPRYKNWRHVFRYSLIFGGIVIALLFALIPMAEQRDNQKLEKRGGGMMRSLNGAAECREGSQDSLYDDQNYQNDSLDQPIINY